jgi:hypothetical protein
LTDQIVSQRKPHPHAEVIKAWADGAQVQFQYYATKEWGDDNSPQFHVERQYRVKPEKVYPVTRMAHSEMFTVYASHLRCKHGYNSVTAETSGLAEVANAALRHAIDADQVVPMAEVQEVARNLNKRRYERAERALLSAGFEDIGGQEWKPPLGKAPHFIEVSDPKRDMAIVKAVMDRVKESATNTYMGNSAYETLIADYAQYDLSAIIAGVRP